jgi:menaquinol-cytochrome c reductase iron-sulfur subunit
VGGGQPAVTSAATAERQRCYAQCAAGGGVAAASFVKGSPVEESKNQQGVERRAFLALVLGWWALLVAFASSAVAGVRYLIPNVLYEPSRRFRLGRPDEFPDGSTFLEELRVFVLRKGNSFRALSAVCTHLGCTVNRAADARTYFCPCHGSKFDEAGLVTGGPAPRELSWHELSLTKDGRLLVDLGHDVKPDKYLVV